MLELFIVVIYMELNQDNIHHQVVHTKEDIDITTAEEMRKGVMHDFGRGRRIVQFFLVVIKRLLGFTFLLVVFGYVELDKIVDA